jgi:hypothetical protein
LGNGRVLEQRGHCALRARLVPPSCVKNVMNSSRRCIYSNSEALPHMEKKHEADSDTVAKNHCRRGL